MKFVFLSLLVLSSTASLAATSMKQGVVGSDVKCDETREEIVERLAHMGVTEIEGDLVDCQSPFDFDFAQPDLIDIRDFNPGF